MIVLIMINIQLLKTPNSICGYKTNKTVDWREYIIAKVILVIWRTKQFFKENINQHDDTQTLFLFLCSSIFNAIDGASLVFLSLISMKLHIPDFLLLL